MGERENEINISAQYDASTRGNQGNINQGNINQGNQRLSQWNSAASAASGRHRRAHKRRSAGANNQGNSTSSSVVHPVTRTVTPHYGVTRTVTPHYGVASLASALRLGLGSVGLPSGALNSASTELVLS